MESIRSGLFCFAPLTDQGVRIAFVLVLNRANRHRFCSASLFPLTHRQFPCSHARSPQPQSHIHCPACPDIAGVRIACRNSFMTRGEPRNHMIDTSSTEIAVGKSKAATLRKKRLCRFSIRVCCRLQISWPRAIPQRQQQY